MTDQQYHANGASNESSSIEREKAQQAIRMLLEALGEDPYQSRLEETWKRRVPSSFETLTEGLRETEKPELRTFDSKNADLVVKTGIPIYSLCEHHILPFHGKAHIAYRPDGGVVGLSKLSRYVRWQSRRLTVQEELTRDIAVGLANEIETPAVQVELTATHLCEAMRGVETATETTTQSTVGELTDAERRRFRSAIDSHE